jgi:hypothetical protein
MAAIDRVRFTIDSLSRFQNFVSFEIGFADSKYLLLETINTLNLRMVMVAFSKVI